MPNLTAIRALRATHESSSRCRVAFATETQRLRLGQKVVSGCSICANGSSYGLDDLRRPQPPRFTLRVSATCRDTKASRKFTKTQQGSAPRRMRRSVRGVLSVLRRWACSYLSGIFVTFRGIFVSRRLAENRRLKATRYFARRPATGAQKRFPLVVNRPADARVARRFHRQRRSASRGAFVCRPKGCPVHQDLNK